MILLSFLEEKNLTFNAMSCTECSFNFKVENKLIKVQLAVLLLECQTVLSGIRQVSLKCPCALEGLVGPSRTGLERKRNLAGQSAVSEELCSELRGRNGGSPRKYLAVMGPELIVQGCEVCRQNWTRALRCSQTQRTSSSILGKRRL